MMNINFYFKIRFRKRFQRKVRTGKPDVVILQDIKDVVLFTCDVKMLNIEFINFFHTNAVDRLLRSLIIYFQFFFQVGICYFHLQFSLFNLDQL